jgi:hypothetical protein
MMSLFWLDDHAVQTHGMTQAGIDAYGLEDRRGIREAGGLDDDTFKCQFAAVPPRKQTGNRLRQIAPDRAAQTARRHQDDLFSGMFDQIVIQTRRAEPVDDHRDAARRGIRQYRVEPRGLSRPRKSGQQGDRQPPIGLDMCVRRLRHRAFP